MTERIKDAEHEKYSYPASFLGSKSIVGVRFVRIALFSYVCKHFYVLYEKSYFMA